ncbi:MAG: Fis family transcriptional regulator [Desulfotomaculales bacterium]
MKKKVFLAVAVTLVLTVLFAGAALAQNATGTNAVKMPQLFQTFLEKFAANLGVDKDKVTEALKQTEEQMIDEAVAEGKMTQEQAAKAKERLQNNQFFFGLFPGHKQFGPREGKGAGPAMLAQALGLSEDELKAQLKEGKTIEEIAQQQGMTTEQLQQKMKELKIQEIQQAVKDGKLTREKADQLIQKIQNAKMMFRFKGV